MKKRKKKPNAARGLLYLPPSSGAVGYRLKLRTAILVLGMKEGFRLAYRMTADWLPLSVVRIDLPRVLLLTFLRRGRAFTRHARNFLQT